MTQSGRSLKGDFEEIFKSNFYAKLDFMSDTNGDIKTLSKILGDYCEKFRKGYLQVIQNSQLINKPNKAAARMIIGS